MKRIFTILICLVAIALFALPSEAIAAGNPAAGKQIFSANCNACHLGGRNVVMAQKTLQKEALEKYLAGYREQGVDAVVYQVTNGKGAMPKFGGRLAPQQIEDVSAYVVQQAESGW